MLALLTTIFADRADVGASRARPSWGQLIVTVARAVGLVSIGSGLGLKIPPEPPQPVTSGNAVRPTMPKNPRREIRVRSIIIVSSKKK